MDTKTLRDNFNIKPIGYVQAARDVVEDDYWGETRSVIQLVDAFEAEALEGVDAFSHVEVIFLFDRVEEAKIVKGARHPRNNKDWPKAGIFAQRGKNRPNLLGSTICRVVAVDGVELTVMELDALDGTPVIDIKPVMSEFLPRTKVEQPEWSQALMSDYWKHENADE